MRADAYERAAQDYLPDYVRPGLDVVFIGAAPSYYAAQVGHYYAGPQNRFWLLLWQSGFTPRRLGPEEDETVFDYGIGLTGVIKNAASSDNTKLPPPTPGQLQALEAKMRAAAPRWVCFNGKDVWRMATGGSDCPWGIQPDEYAGRPTFVVHSSSGRADGWGVDRLYLYKELRRLVLKSRR